MDGLARTPRFVDLSQELRGGWFRGKIGAGGSRQVLGPPSLSQVDYLTVYLFICTAMKIIFAIGDNRIPLRKGSVKELPVLERHFDTPHKDRRLEMAGAPKAKADS